MSKFFKLIFHVSLLILIILSLYPGSLLGYLLYGNLSQQPILVENPFGATINHFFYYFYVTLLGVILYVKNESLKKLVFGLFFLAIILEVLQFLIPNRTFQIEDLIGNILGVTVACFVLKIYLLFNRHE
jgi:VanZ family protein